MSASIPLVRIPVIRQAQTEQTPAPAFPVPVSSVPASPAPVSHIIRDASGAVIETQTANLPDPVDTIPPLPRTRLYTTKRKRIA